MYSIYTEYTYIIYIYIYICILLYLYVCLWEDARKMDREHLNGAGTSRKFYSEALAAALCQRRPASAAFESSGGRVGS